MLVATAGTVLGCVNEGSTRAPAPSPPTPAYRVVTTEDVSMRAVRRLQVRVSLPEHYSRNAVEQVAQAVVADMTKSQPVNAISILFYGPGTSTVGVYDVARVEWAPNGHWDEAGSVETGNYRTFRYSVSYTPPAAQSTASPALTPSDGTGLLGVPLPTGAQLTERTPGDPTLGRDPTERYAVSASAREIAAFFSQAMPAAGWAKDGTSRNNALFFRKGELMIGVLINSSGGTFTLMGS